MNGFEQIGVPVDFFSIQSDHWYDKGIVKCQAVKFDSFYEYIEALNKLGSWSENYSQKTWTYGKEFITRSATDNALINGLASEEALKAIDFLKTKIEVLDDIQRILQTFETMKRRRVYSEEGSELCIDKLLCGSPEHWQKTTKGLQKPVITLAINNTVSGSLSHTQIQTMVSLVIIASDMLERAGFNTQIVSFSTWTGGNVGYKYSVSYCIAKKPNEPIDISKLSNLCLPSIGRYLWFKSVDLGFSGKPTSGKGDSKGGGQILQTLIDHFDINCMVNQDYSSDNYSFNLTKMFKSINVIKNYFPDEYRIV